MAEKLKFQYDEEGDILRIAKTDPILSSNPRSSMTRW